MCLKWEMAEEAGLTPAGGSRLSVFAAPGVNTTGDKAVSEADAATRPAKTRKQTSLSGRCIGFLTSVLIEYGKNQLGRSQQLIRHRAGFHPQFTADTSAFCLSSSSRTGQQLSSSSTSFQFILKSGRGIKTRQL